MRQKKVKALKKAGLWPVRNKWNKDKLPLSSRVKIRTVKKHWKGEYTTLYYYKFPRS